MTKTIKLTLLEASHIASFAKEVEAFVRLYVEAGEVTLAEGETVEDLLRHKEIVVTRCPPVGIWDEKTGTCTRYRWMAHLAGGKVLGCEGLGIPMAPRQPRRRRS